MNESKPLGDAPVRDKLSIPRPGFLTGFTESFGISRSVTVGLLVLIGLMLAGAVFYFIYSAPPGAITITSGPQGSVFYTNAFKYAAILKHEGVKLNLRTSQGSLDNLERLEDPKARVDVGFIQGGITNAGMDRLVSLGSVSFQPLLVFHRGAPVDTLAGLAGRRLAIGPAGSGTRTLVLALLAANGIHPGDTTTLLDWESPVAAQALLDGRVDAVFLMGEDAAPAVMRQLLLAPDVHLMNFAQAEAYTRRFSYLSLLKLPQGGVDFGKNIPAHDVYLIGPTVELVARRNLHPALADVLLQAAQEVHGKAGIFQHQGEFPARLGDDFPLSDEAARFYKSGKSYLYNHLPFWLASITSRIVVVFVPMVVILIPILRSLPHLYRWRNQTRIYRWYRALLVVEKALSREPDAARRRQLIQRLDEIEKEVNKMKVPAFLADQFYSLRGHIALVRELPGVENPTA
jgi:hypothetical protein